MGKEYADHLIKILEEHYVVDKDCDGKKYCRTNLNFDYVKRQVHLSMPSYYSETLTQFQHNCKSEQDNHTNTSYQFRELKCNTPSR